MFGWTPRLNHSSFNSHAIFYLFFNQNEPYSLASLLPFAVGLSAMIALPPYQTISSDNQVMSVRD